MNTLRTPPGFFVNVFTIGIARARWISEANSALGHSTGFFFAWWLQAFANYGLAGRLNGALRAAGSSHEVSQVACLLLTGFPFVGAAKRMRRGTAALNEARSIGQHAVAA